MAHVVSAKGVQAVLEEAASAGASLAAAPTAVADIPDFCAIYRRDIRPLLIAAIAVLRLFKPDWAEALAKVLAFVDGICR
jgi:hypothetical protein